MNITKLYRQGDVLLVAIDKAPRSGCKIRKDGVLLEGEATGHCHRVADLTAAELYDIGDRLYLSVFEQGVSIVHEEHLPIRLPAGDYEVRRQREYNPEAIRNVDD